MLISDGSEIMASVVLRDTCLPGLDYRPVALTSHPAAPLDAWRLARALGKLTRNDLFFSPGYNTPLFCPHLSSSQFTT